MTSYNVAGAVEITRHNRISGWVDAAVGNLARTLDVLINGTRYATFYLDSPAIDGGQPAQNLIRCNLPLPEIGNSQLGERPLVEVRFTETGQVLKNSPRYATPNTRRMRALVLIPAGARYDHDKVRLHNWPVSRIIDTYSNIGDLMVYDSTLKILDFETVEVANIVDFSAADVDRYNREFDFAFLRGSNFIHEHMRWERAGELIEKLRIPVFAIGVGAQAEARREIRLPQEGLRVWAAIADHCASIGVRGAFSAETLAQNGIRNVEVVGCPSIFRARRRDLQLRLKPAYDVRKIAFSLRRETGAGYARNVASYLKIQKDFMLRLDREAEMTVTLHGECEEKAFFFRDPEREAKAVATLRASQWLTPADEAQILDIYRSRLFLNTSVEQYDEFIGKMDLAIGYRVHGVLPALANGTPGILVDYDERSAELARTLQIPLLPEQALVERGWRDIYTPDAFGGFLKHFPACYDKMVEFLDLNGVPHRL